MMTLDNKKCAECCCTNFIDRTVDDGCAQAPDTYTLRKFRCGLTISFEYSAQPSRISYCDSYVDGEG